MYTPALYNLVKCYSRPSPGVCASSHSIVSDGSTVGRVNRASCCVPADHVDVDVTSPKSCKLSSELP